MGWAVPKVVVCVHCVAIYYACTKHSQIPKIGQGSILFIKSLPLSICFNVPFFGWGGALRAHGLWIEPYCMYMVCLHVDMRSCFDHEECERRHMATSAGRCGHLV